jgi:hypothetical protein
MRLRDDDRGASVQIGAILLFGFLIVAVATWQSTVVPQENARVEFTHSQRVTDDMQDVRNAIVSAPGSSTTASVGVDMAPTYPPRSVFVNPGPPAGTLRTVGTANDSLNVTVNNATATDDEAGDYWNGTTTRFNTGGLVYEPGYNVYSSAPNTVYETSVLYDVENGGTVVNVTGQDVVNNRTITLVTLNGSLSRTTSDTYSVDLEALSSSTTTVSVTDDGGDPITISFASRRPPGWWKGVLDDADELDGDGGHVVDVRAGSPARVGAYHNVTLELEPGVTYEFRMAKVGVGSGADDPGKHYMVDVRGDGTSLEVGNTRELVVEVRDRYNNPVSGATVELNDSESERNGGSLDDTSKTTDSEGRAAFEYTGGSAGTATIVFDVSGDVAPEDRELVPFTVDVTSSGSAYSVLFNESRIEDLNDAADYHSNNGTLLYDTSKDGDTVLETYAETNPQRTGVEVDFAHNNSTLVEGFENADAETNDSGVATADLNTTGLAGDLLMEVTSDAGYDDLRVRVLASNPNMGAIYAETNNNDVRSVDRSGRKVEFNSGSAEAVGPGRVDFDGDSLKEVPFVDSSQNLKLVDRNDNVETLVTGSVEKTALAVGTWNGSDQSVFYVDSDSPREVRRVDGNGNVSTVADFGTKLKGVAGIGDIDDDSADELVAVTNGNKVFFFDDDGTVYDTGANVASNNNIGIGPPADYDGDGGKERVPIVDGSNNLVLVGCSFTLDVLTCTETQVLTDTASKTPVGTFDWNEDGQPDITFANSSDNDHMYYAEIQGTGTSASADTVVVLDVDGNKVKVYVYAGVA